MKMSMNLPNKLRNLRDLQKTSKLSIICFDAAGSLAKKQPLPISQPVPTIFHILQQLSVVRSVNVCLFYL